MGQDDNYEPVNTARTASSQNVTASPAEPSTKPAAESSTKPAAESSSVSAGESEKISPPPKQTGQLNALDLSLGVLTIDDPEEKVRQETTARGSNSIRWKLSCVTGKSLRSSHKLPQFQHRAEFMTGHPHKKFSTSTARIMKNLLMKTRRFTNTQSLQKTVRLAGYVLPCVTKKTGLTISASDLFNESKGI